MAQLPKGGLVRSYDKPIHWSCAIYFPGGIYATDSTYEGNQVHNHGIPWYRSTAPSDSPAPRLHCIVKASDLEDGRDHEGNHRGKPGKPPFFFCFSRFFFGWERSAHEFLLNRYQKMGDSERRCPGIFGIFEIIMQFHMC